MTNSDIILDSEKRYQPIQKDMVPCSNNQTSLAARPGWDEGLLNSWLDRQAGEIQIANLNDILIFLKITTKL